MKVFMIGVTGLLGLEGAKELLKRGHLVKGIALPPLGETVPLPESLEIIYDNYLTMNDDELKSLMKDCDSFVFAAGIDERVESPPPIYDMFKRYNIDSLKRILDICRELEYKNICILGSYFSFFSKEWKSLELTKYHPYIRSRIGQETLAFEYAKYNMNISVLEIPYVFGAQKGRKPVWYFIAEMIHKNEKKTMYYPKGGTAMVTKRQVGEAIVGALENTKGAVAYPVGWFNMEWREWIELFSSFMGEHKEIKTIPTFLYKFYAKKLAKEIKEKGLESGLDMVEFVKIMTANTFIKKDIARDQLGVTDDDIKLAIKESVDACLDIINNPSKEFADMRKE